MTTQSEALANLREAQELYGEALDALRKYYPFRHEDYENYQLACEVLHDAEQAYREAGGIVDGITESPAQPAKHPGYYVVSKREGLFYGFVTLALAAIVISAIGWAVLFLLGEFCRAGACL